MYNLSGIISIFNGWGFSKKEEVSKSVLSKDIFISVFNVISEENARKKRIRLEKKSKNLQEKSENSAKQVEVLIERISQEMKGKKIDRMVCFIQEFFCNCIKSCQPSSNGFEVEFYKKEEIYINIKKGNSVRMIRLKNAKVSVDADSIRFSFEKYQSEVNCIVSILISTDQVNFLHKLLTIGNFPFPYSKGAYIEEISSN